jgi:hypothetical protein
MLKQGHGQYLLPDIGVLLANFLSHLDGINPYHDFPLPVWMPF